MNRDIDVEITEGGLSAASLKQLELAEGYGAESTIRRNDVKAGQTVPKNIDEYIAGFAPEVRSILKKVRATIRKAAPGAAEKISYRIPAFTLHGSLVYFAAFKNHIGFYPPVRGDAKLKKEAAVHAGPKGNLEFPLDEPIPYTLISKLVKFRVKENLKKAVAKRKKK